MKQINAGEEVNIIQRQRNKNMDGLIALIIISVIAQHSSAVCLPSKPAIQFGLQQ